jgi:hypothetical protein
MAACRSPNRIVVVGSVPPHLDAFLQDNFANERFESIENVKISKWQFWKWESNIALKLYFTTLTMVSTGTTFGLP